DLNLPFSDITPEFLKELEAMEPFGMGNPEPTFRTTAVVIRSARIVGKNHLKMSLTHQGILLDAILFRHGEKVPPQKTVDLAFSPEWNEWNGERSIQLRIKGIS
ncbi:MAG: single-stranded-DNA-specific exonuclease RecJ, partial [Deltaproteobacteria bacterium]|nr:single-stranded-DNA-specific exonuclease RecJ [Deltaproteobacteria bacterium]